MLQRIIWYKLTNISEVLTALNIKEYFWNVGQILPDYTAQQSRRQPSSYSSPWKLEISSKWCEFQFLKEVRRCLYPLRTMSGFLLPQTLRMPCRSVLCVTYNFGGLRCTKWSLASSRDGAKYLHLFNEELHSLLQQDIQLRRFYTGHERAAIECFSSIYISYK
jgi:hypothetical protein